MSRLSGAETLILSSSIVIFFCVVTIGFLTICILLIARQICMVAVTKKLIPPFTKFCVK